MAQLNNVVAFINLCVGVNYICRRGRFTGETFTTGLRPEAQDKERICAIRIILRKIDRSTRPADW